MTVYLDEVLVLNFTADYLLLLITARVIGEPLRRKRFAIAATTGSAYAAARYLPNFGWLGGGFMKLLLGMGMVYIAYGRSRKLLRQWLLFLLVSCGFAGIEMALFGCMELPFSLPLFIASFLIGYLLLGVSFRGSGRAAARGLLIPVTVEYGGKRVKYTALLDTGCGLSDPRSGDGVLIVSREALGVFLDGKMPETTEEISFETISGTGILHAFRCDALIVGKKRIPQALVAVYRGRFIGNHQALWGGTWEGSRSDDFAWLAESMGKAMGLAAAGAGVLHRRKRYPAAAPQPGGGDGTADKAS